MLFCTCKRKTFLESHDGMHGYNSSLYPVVCFIVSSILHETCKHLALLYRHVYIFLDLILNTKHCNFFINITACCRAASCRMLFCFIQIWKVHLGDVHGRDCASGLGETEEEWSALWRGGLLPHGHQRALLHQICLWNWSVRNRTTDISPDFVSLYRQNTILQYRIYAALLTNSKTRTLQNNKYNGKNKNFTKTRTCLFFVCFLLMLTE